MSVIEKTHRQRGKPQVWLWPRNGPKLDLSDVVISFSCSKSVTEPQGRFHLELLPLPITRQGPAVLSRLPRLYKSLRPGDMVSIGFNEPGGIMLGIIERVERAVEKSNSADVSLRVTGSDFGKILTQDNIIHASLTVDKSTEFATKLESIVGPDHPLVQVLFGIWGPDSKDGGKDATPGVFENQSVSDVVDFVLNSSISMTIPNFMFEGVSGGSQKPGDFFTSEGSITTWNDGRVWNEGLNNYQGNMWGFLTGLIDKDFYEIYVQTTPNDTELPRVDLVIRPKPFDEAALEFLPIKEQTGNTWEDLTTAIDGLEHHEIDGTRIMSMQVGRSDSDVFSYYEVTARHDLIGNSQAQAMGLYYPAIDTWQLQRFGLRAYRTEVSLLGTTTLSRTENGEEPDPNELSNEAREFRSRLLNWHRLADYFESGTVKVVGYDRYRPGDPVFLPFLEPAFGDEKGLRFYMPSVTWSWSFGGHYTCTLDLIRGHNNGVIEAAKADIADSATPEVPDHIVEAMS